MPDEGLQLVARSAWWISAAWPDPSGPEYLNGVAIVRTDLSPPRTLAALHRVEARFGRARAEANASRTLDLTLVAHGRTVLDGDVVVPHPRAQRAPVRDGAVGRAGSGLDPPRQAASRPSGWRPTPRWARRALHCQSLIPDRRERAPIVRPISAPSVRPRTPTGPCR
ncbi:2-amino-4-hydroxy-6-hydroxymethyldihydropteridine diphosphokinase [Caulobacter segnis]